MAELGPVLAHRLLTLELPEGALDELRSEETPAHLTLAVGLAHIMDTARAEHLDIHEQLVMAAKFGMAISAARPDLAAAWADGKDDACPPEYVEQAAKTAETLRGKLRSLLEDK